LIEQSVARIAAESQFSGAVRVDRGAQTELATAFGYADRRHKIANTVQTQFAIASGVKGLTALAVVSLIQDGLLSLDSRARSVLGADLPLIDDAVTIEQLLAHRSGIGDYFDEDADQEITDYVLPIPVHRLDRTEGYLSLLDGLPAKFPPGERFSYCNSGYVVLALVAERVSRVPFADLVLQRVCQPAGMEDTAFLRSDELPGRAAVGYLSTGDASRTNVLHLPVVGSGDGGIYSTVADLHSFWTALFAGRVVSTDWVSQLIRPRSDVPAESMRYGLGFWLHATGAAVMLEGYDAGVSFRTVHDPGAALTHTTISNTSDGAWPLTRHLDQLLSNEPNAD
jgi:CubicO group peptidase (beta-lactamase class C family)